MSKKLKVGVMGCGNISTTYFDFGPLFKDFEIVACADLKTEMATARAKQYKVEAMKPAELLGHKDLDLIVNLTVPAAHFGVSLAAVKAGKHVYSEKPLTLSLKDGVTLAKAAKAKKVKVCSAPDTILGGSHQLARKAIDDGVVGKITSGIAAVQNFGMEHWHPNPDFFYQPGGGPILDLGPYYVANLINFLGPVKRVAALSSKARKEREISSEPRSGQKLKVKVDTNFHCLLEFAQGATITLIASWDVYAHRLHNMELYGSEGSIYIPDPNAFGGDVLVTKREAAASVLPRWDHPFYKDNMKWGETPVANYRTAGLADMAQSIVQKREARCSIERTLHAVEVMTSILKSGETGKFIPMTTTCKKPALLGPEEARALLK